MSEITNQNHLSISNVFDQDYSHHHGVVTIDQPDVSLIDYGVHHVYSVNDIFDLQDPLNQVHAFDFTPFHLDLGDTHFVKPHAVSSYVRQDGTSVESYVRDGDGNTNVNLTEKQGGGYIRTNPDGIPFNNLNRI